MVSWAGSVVQDEEGQVKNDERALEQTEAIRKSLEAEGLASSRRSVDGEVRSANAAVGANPVAYVAIGISLMALAVAVAGLFYPR